MEYEPITDKLIAKSKGIRGRHKVIFSDAGQMDEVNLFYKAPTITHEVPFTPEQKVEDDEWFYIDLEQTQKEELIGPYIRVASSTADANAVKAVDYQNVEAIYKVSGNKIIFSKVTDSYRVENKHFLHLGNHPKLETSKQAIEFRSMPDAYFDGASRLYFRNYSTIRPLFSGIEQFFREATQTEKDEFLGSKFFAVGEADIRIGVRAAKKIAAILDDDSIDLGNKQTQKKIREYAAKYKESGVVFLEDGRLSINSTKELNHTLTLLSGRYYTSELTGEKMEARDSLRLE